MTSVIRANSDSPRIAELAGPEIAVPDRPEPESTARVGKYLCPCHRQTRCFYVLFV